MSDDQNLTFLHRIWIRTLAAAGVIAAIMLSWWWKIEDIRTPENTPVVTMGQPINMGRSKFTPLSLELTRGPDQAKQLVLLARVENVTSKTQAGAFGYPPTPPEIAINGSKLAEPKVTLKRDNELLTGLQPRLPEDILLTWTVPADWQTEPITIRFSKELFKLRDNLYGQSNWLGTSPVAQMTVMPEVKL